MLLESLIQNGQKVTFDCYKATISKGGIIEIPDIHFSNPEITGAIKLGLVRLVGPAPVVAPTAAQLVRKVRLQNKSPYLLTFECVKGSVAKGAFIEIPENLMNEREIINALSSRMLEDVDNPRPAAVVSEPVSLDELTSGDIELASQTIDVSPRKQEQTIGRPEPRQARPRQTRRGGARPIQRSGDSDGGDLYGESQVRDVKPTRRNQAGSSAAPIPIDVDSSSSEPEVSFDDIFEA